MKKLLAAASLLAILFATAVNGQDEKKKKKTEDMTVVEVAAGNKMFSTLVTAVKAGDLVETLSGKGPFTVFAPTNKAFEALGEETLNKVLADKELLKKVLLTHVVVGKSVMAEDVVKMEGKEVNGYKITLEEKKVVLVGEKNKVTVVKTDIKCKNGVIHVIDTVMLPK
jgi:uncharacterized surface protein with fasciclin (FAS1) repeats